MAFTPITITGTFTKPDGSAASGTVTAILSMPLENGTAQVTPTPIVGILDASGALKDDSGLAPFVLEANDDTGTTPAGSTYEFLIELDSAPVRAFSAVVPHATSPIDITTLEP
jgi:hypothetical protein